MTLKDLLRDKLLDSMVRLVQPAARWKVMVVDDEALRILNSACRPTDLQDEHVISVEGLHLRRQPYPDREVIYFITAEPVAFQRIIDDFTGPKPPYAAVHIFTCSTIPDTLFKSLRTAKVSQYIRNIKELNVDFSPLEPYVFTVNAAAGLGCLYNATSPSLRKYELEKVAKRITSVLASLGENPQIRYCQPDGKSDDSVSRQLAYILQAELDEAARNDPKLLVAGKPPATILIMDRANDIISPLVHQFSYQAFIGDVLTMDDWNFINEKGEKTTLDEKDKVWNQIRYYHIAEVMEMLAQMVKTFTSENKAAAFQLGGGKQDGSTDGKLNQLKDTLAHLPEYQETKELLSRHTTLCQDAMRQYTERDLGPLAKVEQELATGENAEGKPCRLNMLDIQSMVENPRVGHEDKLRLILLYIISKNGVSDTERQRLVDRAKLTMEEQQAVHNLSMLGIRLSASMSKARANKKILDTKPKVKENRFEDERFSPLLENVLTDHFKGRLNEEVFPYVRAAALDADQRPSSWNVASPTASVRSKASWATRRAVVSATANSAINAAPTGERKLSGPRTFVFFLGGVTPTEVKVCNDVSRIFDKEVVLGTTRILHPHIFVEQLKVLHRSTLARPVKSSSTEDNRIRSTSSRDRDRDPDRERVPAPGTVSQARRNFSPPPPSQERGSSQRSSPPPPRSLSRPDLVQGSRSFPQSQRTEPAYNPRSQFQRTDSSQGSSRYQAAAAQPPMPAAPQQQPSSSSSSSSSSLRGLAKGWRSKK
ncbi:Sec1-like protein [Phlyctochytrium arcticum]|nr:Sec1-like protein [Phlyctochytrium arcticum]